jgi:hypothetical protein
MGVLLREIRSEFQQHLDTQVATSAAFRPAAGASINVGETFLVDVTARNSSAVDSIQLKNVVFHVKVLDPAIAKLAKPTSTQGIARAGAAPSSAQISDLAFPVAEYFLHPPTNADAKTLAPGETDTISGLPAKALAVGTARVNVNLFADPDLQWLFPVGEDTPAIQKTLTVLE